MTVQIPQGYRVNAQGHMVPESQIKPIDLIRDDLVQNVVTAARQQQQALAAFKLLAMNEVTDFVDLSAEAYDVKYGGTKGNVTLMSFDGRYKLVRAKGEHRVFDERIQAAKTLIDACINRWSENVNDHIKALVDHAFRVNKQGRIDVNQVLSLRQLDIDDDQWNEAMDAIADSIQVTGTSSYLRLYERNSDDSYRQIPLDIAKL
ncbi:sulfate transporter [Enterovibrio norvegicus]|uniref:Sulfate transporter n=2 Tax=Vibrionaceae TaxID=641 RepID=A0A2N7L867_9GAMM|nr:MULTISPECIES: DUF3164 family protein [Vibrionaceae]PMH60045.1 sulfate transporter [Enterovibrio norvegicus]PMI33541.1 sulfate transporter [Enterovibrio norvegicus]PMN44268.1 sulfate transporter [Enterovibrio norvegicus]PMN90298.1 sulfate transporter [Enterovibrio norvegicus]PMN91353.1 sulfate transporter [Enterovibrio norvegicus]